MKGIVQIKRLLKYTLVIILPFHLSAQDFSIDHDLLLANFDCKTDVDDLHTMAALATLLSQPAFAKVNYHAVAGAYGVQEGLYVPPNELCKAAFGNKWSDAHTDFDQALLEVFDIIYEVLKKGGDIWIAEAGQSDFSAALVRKLKSVNNLIDTRKRIHLVQHSEWNQNVTDSLDFDYVNVHTDYHKIPDGNAVGNGTPGFRSEEKVDWEKYIDNEKLISIWQLAIELGNKYNGKEGRYNNEAIAKGGLDFSDLSETCWILGLKHISDAQAFFEFCAQK